MDTVFPIIIGIALAATFGVLATGFVAMTRGGEFNHKYGNLMMRARISTQGATVLLVLFYFLWRLA